MPKINRSQNFLTSTIVYNAVDEDDIHLSDMEFEQYQGDY